jgi:O-antigen/teichoic acid export membrane protein
MRRRTAHPLPRDAVPHSRFVSRLGPERARAAAGWRFAYLLAQAGGSLILFAGVAQLLPADQFAATAVALGALVLAQAVGDFGLSQAAVTVLPARMAAQPGRRADLLAGAARGSAWAALAGAIITVCLAVAVAKPARDPTLLVAPAAATAVVLAGIDGLMRSVGEFRRPVGLMLMSRIGSLAALPVAAVADSATAVCIAVSAGSIVGSMPAGLALLQRARLSREPEVKGFLRAALPLGASQVMVVGAARANTVMVSVIASVGAAAAFEGAWRLYQLGQYVAGGLATAVAPLIAHALGSREDDLARREIRRAAAVVAGLGLSAMVALLVLDDPASRLLFGADFGPRVARALTPLAIVTPLAFVAFLATVVLAVGRRGRRLILAANTLATAINVTLVIILVPTKGALGATIAAAAGIGVASAALVACLPAATRRPRAETA